VDIPQIRDPHTRKEPGPNGIGGKRKKLISTNPGNPQKRYKDLRGNSTFTEWMKRGKDFSLSGEVLERRDRTMSEVWVKKEFTHRKPVTRGFRRHEDSKTRRDNGEKRNKYT